jgi:hypothetical protein
VFGFCYIFYRTANTTMIMTWAKPGEEGKLSAIRLLVPVLGHAIGTAAFALFFDNALLPTTDQAAEILSHFHHAVWFGLVIVVVQIACTLRSRNAKIPTRSPETNWQGSDSFWDRG